ncbi:hypothetical protein BS78_K267500 [Paspalum vaginatum]|uniref:R13L1/DRL21-like LRR repeat region domain-containing protein n=1 Tax=Paspalum vaginatum TaxID=158149 RepID=A0A9W7X8I3_9POAL|nr:hypothetical protein BS78_K267500 [Paspalum vaginatum]
MDNLIHLRHTYASTDLPNVGKLTSLQTMEYFHVDKKEQGYKLKQLKNLNNLRGYLKIVGLANVVSKEEALEAQLASKKRLTSLSLGFCGGTKASGIKAEVLEGLCPPKHLQKLTIEYDDTSKYPSWMLSGQHPDAPKHLHSLQLNYCSLLESIPEDSELFRHLRELNIHNCNGSSLPENMERLVSLQSLSISGSGDKMKLPPTLPRSLNKIRIKGFDWDSLPEHVKWPISLQSLDICYCNKIALLPASPVS